MKKSLKRKNLLLMLGIFFTLFITFNVNFNSPQQLVLQETEDILEDNPKRAGYWIVSPITINDNDPSSNWATIKATYAWCDGSGTGDDPYVIENVFIDGLGYHISCISIMNSDVFFKIQNCTLINASYGIKLDYTSKGLVDFNILQDNNASGIGLFNSNGNFIHMNKIYNNRIYGIYLSESENNVITHNNISIYNIPKYNTIFFGIRLYLSNDNQIVNNTIYNSDFGVEIYGDYNEIVFNFIYNITNAGIALKKAYQNIISGNFVYNNSNIGLDIYQSNSTRVKYNIFNNNSQGIVLYDANSNVLKCNNITHNKFYGIFLSNFTNNNIISWNNFIENCHDPSSIATSQAYDWQSDSGNNFHHNYWSDWSGNGVYTIDGPSGTFTNEDSNPQDNPIDECPQEGEEIIGLSTINYFLILTIACVSLIFYVKKRKQIKL